MTEKEIIEMYSSNTPKGIRIKILYDILDNNISLVGLKTAMSNEKYGKQIKSDIRDAKNNSMVINISSSQFQSTFLSEEDVVSVISFDVYISQQHHAPPGRNSYRYTPPESSSTPELLQHFIIHISNDINGVFETDINLAKTRGYKYSFDSLKKIDSILRNLSKKLYADDLHLHKEVLNFYDGRFTKTEVDGHGMIKRGEWVSDNIIVGEFYNNFLSKESIRDNKIVNIFK